jgi:ABC-type Zn uptake system ZnuABC Zn-binding protein ZnuA
MVDRDSRRGGGGTGLDWLHHVVGRDAGRRRGDEVTLIGLIPPGVDSHTFEPSPSTVKDLTRADVLFLNGLHLEGSTRKQAEANMAKGSPIVALGDRTLAAADYAYDFTFPRDKGDPNPHLWMDPTYVRRWSEIVRDTMIGVDPPRATRYRENQARFAAVLDRLDGAIAATIASIPAARRKLVTYHDSFAYFARRYGMTVVGAVQPSDFSEPSPREIQSLIDQVRAEGVTAVFGSEVFPSSVLRQVAAQSGARYVDELRDDELPGAAGSSQHTYVGLMVADVTLMTRALGGDPSPLLVIPTAPTWVPS